MVSLIYKYTLLVKNLLYKNIPDSMNNYNLDLNLPSALAFSVVGLNLITQASGLRYYEFYFGLGWISGQAVGSGGVSVSDGKLMASMAG